MAKRLELVSVQCPSCGANLPPSRPCGSYVCAYCGGQFEVAHARSAQTAQGVSIDVAKLARDLEPAAKTVAGVAIAIVGGALLIVVVVIASVIIPLMRSTSAGPTSPTTDTWVIGPQPASPQRNEPPAGPRTPAPPPEPPPPPPPPPVQLSPPFLDTPAFVTAVEQPLMIVRMRRRGPEDDLLIDAYRVADSERVWRFEVGASYSEGHTFVRYAVEGDRVLVSDHRANVHVFDGPSGEIVATATLSDHVHSLCRAQAGMLVRAKDQQTLRFDPISDQLVAHTRTSDECGRYERTSPLPDHLFKRETTLRRPERSQVEGSDTHWRRAFDSSADTLLFGYRSPGTHVPRVGRINAGAETLAWVTDVPEGSMLEVGTGNNSAVSDGARVYVVHSRAEGGWVLTAIDGARGDRLWSSPLAASGMRTMGESLAVVGSMIVVSEDDELLGYDAATGERRWSLRER